MRYTTRELLAFMVVMGNASAVAAFIVPSEPALFWAISLTVAGLASSSYVIGVAVGRTNQPANDGS
jgi:hypothetical protein